MSVPDRPLDPPEASRQYLEALVALQEDQIADLKALASLLEQERDAAQSALEDAEYAMNQLWDKMNKGMAAIRGYRMARKQA